MRWFGLCKTDKQRSISWLHTIYMDHRHVIFVFFICRIKDSYQMIQLGHSCCVHEVKIRCTRWLSTSTFFSVRNMRPHKTVKQSLNLSVSIEDMPNLSMAKVLMSRESSITLWPLRWKEGNNVTWLHCTHKRFSIEPNFGLLLRDSACDLEIIWFCEYGSCVWAAKVIDKCFFFYFRRISTHQSIITTNKLGQSVTALSLA